ncbi:hypothetical protein BDZ89DRAFT_1049823 [Hymenopellis radicata]|nr:hypothetical protein BDZ89DRAFT_1049823 [Hymenopellis radicata]
MSPIRTASTLSRPTDPTQAAANSTGARSRGQGDRNGATTQGNKSKNTGGRKRKSTTNATRGHGTGNQPSEAGQQHGNDPARPPLVPTSNGNAAAAADGSDAAAEARAAELARLKAQIDQLLQNGAASNGQSAPQNASTTQNGAQNANSANSSPVQNATAIQVINKPRGEPSNGRTGYCLQDEMQMDDDIQYNEFLASIRRNAARAGIDYGRSFKNQELSVIDNVCKLCVKENPYLTKRRFPNYWPLTAALKVHIANARKYRKRRVTEYEQEGGQDDSDRENNDVDRENNDVDRENNDVDRENNDVDPEIA